MHIERLCFSSDCFEHFHLLSDYQHRCTSRKSIWFALNPTTRMSQKQQNKSGSVTTDRPMQARGADTMGWKTSHRETGERRTQASGNHMAATQHIQDCRHGDGERLRFKVAVGMVQKGSVCDSEIDVGASLAGPSVSLGSSWFYREWPKSEDTASEQWYQTGTRPAGLRTGHRLKRTREVRESYDDDDHF